MTRPGSAGASRGPCPRPRRVSARARFILPAAALAILAALPGSAAAGEFAGVRGFASFKGDAAPGVTVYAYREFERGRDSEPFARSTPTDRDGAYSLELPPGRWFLVAARTDGRPASDLLPGDLYCYFGGNPVRVDPGRASAVGLQLVRIEADPGTGAPDGVSGVVYGEDGRPLAGAVVTLHRSPGDGFRGIPAVFARTAEDGTFRLRVRKGTFFLVARKRGTGDLFGPTLPGDHFGYYPRNPVALAEGEAKGVRIDALPRQSAAEKLGDAGRGGDAIVVRARTVDRDGRPVPGIRLLAYRSAAMTGSPAYVSVRSGADGTVLLEFGEEGSFFLLARERLGGPAAEGEWYGRYAGSPDHSVRVSRGAAAEPLSIVLEKR